MKRIPLSGCGVYEEHIRNLKQLARYVRRGEWPEGVGFHMESYVSHQSNYGDKAIDFDGNECDTVCCLVGMGPLAGLPLLPGGKYRESYQDYQLRVFGIKASTLNDAHQFLFDTWWQENDNTPMGGVRRIAYAIKFGVPVFDLWINQTYFEYKQLSDYDTDLIINE